MVDTEDLKSFAFGRAGSSPAGGTSHYNEKTVKGYVYCDDTYPQLLHLKPVPFGEVTA